jgi:hypothetical protein
MSWKTDSKIAPAALVAPYHDGITDPSAADTGEKRFRRRVETENAVPSGSVDTRHSAVPAGHVTTLGASGDRRAAPRAIGDQSSDSDAW